MLTTNPTLSIPTSIVARGAVVAVPIMVNQLTDNPAGSFTASIATVTQPSSFNNLTDIPLSSYLYVNCTRLGLSSADFAVNFDPNEFSVSPSDILLGNILTNIVAFTPQSLQPNATSGPAGWTLTSSMSPAHPGQISIHIAAANQYAVIISGAATTAPETPGSLTDPLSEPPAVVGASSDSLVIINFHVKGTAALGQTPVNLVASNAVGIKPTAMYDATGRKYNLAVAPTNGGNSPVAGMVNVVATPPALGTWTAITATGAPAVLANIQTETLGNNMMLLPDGSLLAHGFTDQFGLPSADWFRLTPNATTGDYATGTWTQTSPMPDLPFFTPEDLTEPTPPGPIPELQGGGRLAFGSVVMQDGRMMIMGGEHTSTSVFDPAEDPTGLIYDPVADTWTQIASFPQPLFDQSTLAQKTQDPYPPQQFGDSALELMSDGTVLGQMLGYVWGSKNSTTYRYSPTSDQWVQDATLLNNDRSNEEGWTKLGDGSILSVQVFGTNQMEAERLILGNSPADDRWVDAGHVPVNLATNNDNFAELGPGILLNDGRVFYIGATNNTAIYTPPSPGNPTGSWKAGPVIPFGKGANDAPAAVLPNGRVLLAVGDTPGFTGGTTLYEYDPVTNLLNRVTNLPAPLGTFLQTQIVQQNNMIVLPTGQVMFTTAFNPLLPGQAVGYLYTSAGTPNDSWRPTITGVEQTDVTPAGAPIYTLTGTQLNGLTEGAYFGDDLQMATNYPVIQFVDQTGAVRYATTFDWSSAWVATGSTLESVKFTLPGGLSLSSVVSLRVIANGISSFPTDQSIMLGGVTTAGSVIVRVHPGNAGLVDIVNAATNATITTHPNNSNWGTINILGDASNNVVTIDETNGIVNAPVHFNGGGAGSPANDQLVIVGVPLTTPGTGNDNIVISPTSATTGGVTDNGSATYSYENITKVLVDGQTGTNAVSVVDTVGGGASIDVNGATVDYNGGTPFFLSNTQTLTVNDNSATGGDTINVLGTSIPTTVGNTAGAGGDTINVVSDAPSNQFGDLTGIAAKLTVATSVGHNTLLVSDIGSSAAGLTFGLTNKQITATDLPTPIAYTNGTGTLNIVLDGSNLVPTIFNVASTLPAISTVTLNGGAPNGNAFNIGSTALANNGKLGGIGAAITVNGGAGTGNTLEVNDHGTTGAFNYSVSDTSVNYGPGSPIPPTFGGVTYSNIATLRLDATEQANKITVAPSLTTVMQINAYGQLGGADSLQINTANVSGPVTNNPPGGPNGFFSFVDGHQNVNYTNIESFPTSGALVSFPIIAYAPDTGLNSQPLVKVFNAQTGQQVLPSSPFDPANPQRGFLAYEASYHGGVRIAVGFFDTSGQPEIAVAPGAGHAPIVEVFSAFGQLLYSFNPGYAASVTGGLNIAAGNVFPVAGASAEIDDLVTVPSRGVSEVKVFYNQFHTNPAPAAPFVSNDSVHNRDFTAWTSTFIGGSTVAVADVNADGRGDIIVGSGPGMAGTINTYDVTLNKKSYTPLASFTPFGAAYRGGVNVSAVTPTAGSNITAPMIAASQQQGTGQVKLLNGSTGAVQFTTNVAANSAVRTTSRIVNGRYLVFVAVPSNGSPTGLSKIVEFDPLAANAVDFIFDSDPTFSRLNLG